VEKIRSKDITVMRHAADGFTLSYVTDEGDYYHKRYVGYSVEDAKKRFKEYAHEESSKVFRCMSYNDALIRALL
jgi:hypothetical protein